MIRDEFDVEYTLDHTELQLWPRWIKSIRTYTKVREVKNYPNWVVRSFAGGPVWEEFQITKEEMHFMTPLGEYMKDEEELGKYGRKMNQNVSEAMQAAKSLNQKQNRRKEEWKRDWVRKGIIKITDRQKTDIRFHQENFCILTKLI